MKRRIAARVLVEDNGKILFSKCKDDKGIFYTLPGGGIEKTELAKEAALRECYEETGYKVIVGELVLTKEFIKKISEIPAWANGIHQVELVFKSTLDKSFTKENAKQKDSNQIDISWLKLSELKNYRIFPANELDKYLKDDCKLDRYIGIREL